MHRTNIYIDDDLNDQLRQAAILEKRPAAAIVRDALRGYLQERIHRRAAIDDPFADIIGAFSSGRGDMALNHDRYLYGEDLDAERRAGEDLDAERHV